MNPLPETTFQLDTAVTLIFLILVGIYTIFSAILYYHWKTYATEKQVSRITLLIYFSLTLPLLLVMGISALIF